jgi:hypothetical protein
MYSVPGWRNDTVGMNSHNPGSQGGCILCPPQKLPWPKNLRTEQTRQAAKNVTDRRVSGSNVWTELERNVRVKLSLGLYTQWRT